MIRARDWTLHPHPRPESCLRVRPLGQPTRLRSASVKLGARLPKQAPLPFSVRREYGEVGGKENASEPVGCPLSTPPCTAIRHCGAMRLFLCPRGCASGSSLRRCTEYHGLTVTDGPTPLCTCASSMVLRGIHNNMLFFFNFHFENPGVLLKPSVVRRWSLHA